jgi:hypothetical protein
LDDANCPFFDTRVHHGIAVASFHNSNDWVKAQIFYLVGSTGLPELLLPDSMFYIIRNSDYENG